MVQFITRIAVILRNVGHFEIMNGTEEFGIIIIVYEVLFMVVLALKSLIHSLEKLQFQKKE